MKVRASSREPLDVVTTTLPRPTSNRGLGGDRRVPATRSTQLCLRWLGRVSEDVTDRDPLTVLIDLGPGHQGHTLPQDCHVVPFPPFPTSPRTTSGRRSGPLSHRGSPRGPVRLIPVPTTVARVDETRYAKRSFSGPCPVYSTTCLHCTACGPSHRTRRPQRPTP